MDFLFDLPLPAPRAFALFFGASFALLGSIALIGLVGRLPHLRRLVRHMRARRTRGERMLADLDKLRSDALELEGCYYFEDPGAPIAFDYEADVERRTSDAA